MMTMMSDATLLISQSPLLILLAKATLILALGLGAAALASHAPASVRHLLLATSLAAVLVLPAVVALGPSLTLEVTRPQPERTVGVVAPARTEVPADARPATTTTPATTGNAMRWAWLIPTAWAVGAVLTIAPLLITLGRLRWIRRTGLPLASRLPLPIGRGIEVLRHEGVLAPITFGLHHSVIVLPADAGAWSRADLSCALRHELEHIRRYDWAVHMMARAACAIYWFHPLVWIAGRQLTLEAERACDDAVVAEAECTAYAEQLVMLAQRLSHSAQPTLGMANRSDLSRRVAALLDGTQRRGRAGLRVAASAIATGALVVSVIGPLTTVARVEAAVTNTAIASAQPSARQPMSERRARAIDRALYEAADEGDRRGVEDLIAAGANVNAQIDGDGSPLIGAARSGDLAIVNRLIEAGADVNLAVEGDGSPLIQAAARGHRAIVSVLLDRGAHVDQIVKGDENALMGASEGGHLPVVRLLVERGANVHERIWAEWPGRDGEWRTAISQARKNGHDDVVSYLMSVGARE